MRTLIVGDDTKLRNALANYLKSQSLETVQAESIDTAEHILNSQPMPLIFISDRLKDTSPSTACERVRAASGGAQPRIVALAQMDTPRPRDVRDFAGMGFDAVLGRKSSADEIMTQVIIARNALRADRQPAQPQHRPERNHAHLETISTLGFYLANGASVDRQAQHALHALNELFPGIQAAIWLHQDSAVTLAGSTGLSANYAESAEQHYGALTPSQWTSRDRQPEFIADARQQAGALADLAESEGFVSAVHVTLAAASGPIGLLAVYLDQPAPPSDADLMLLDTIASMTALAIVVTREKDAATSVAETADEAAPARVDPIYRAIFEQLPEAVFVNDQHGRIIHANRALADLSGYSQEELTLRNLVDLVAQDDAATVLTQLGIASQQDDDSAPVHGPLPVEIVRNQDGTVRAELLLRRLPTGGDAEDAHVEGVLRELRGDPFTERVTLELEALQDILRITASEQNLNAVIRGVFNTVSQRLHYPTGGVWTFNRDGTRLTARATSGQATPQSLTLDAGIVGEVIETREPVFVPDIALDPRAAPFRIDATSQIGVPIMRGERLFGVLLIEGNEEHPLGERDLQFLSALAGQLAGLIERSELYQDLERQAITDPVTNLPNRLAFQQALDLAVARAKRNRVSVLDIGIDGFKTINELYGHAIGDEILRQISDTLKSRTQSNQFLARYTSDQFLVLLPNVNRDDAVTIAESLRIAVAMQLFTAAEQVEQLTVSIGAATYPDDATTSQGLLQAADHALSLAKRAGRNQVFQSNAAFATLAPAHGRLNDLLRQSPSETLSLLIRAMDQRLPERAGHSERVTRYALTIARQLGVPDAEIPRLRLAAYIHDIGMVSLPDALLRKPSALSSNERDLLRGVPVAAHGLLAQLDLPESIPLAVLHQRERWDGSGYPTGLRGEEIPLGARIIAVADAIDAMTSPRAHRSPMTIEQALDELHKQAGTQFDPAVVKAAEVLKEAIPAPPPVQVPVTSELSKPDGSAAESQATDRDS